MKRGLICWICPGDMAPCYTGKVGDIFVSGVVTAFLQSKGWQIHFVANRIMACRLQDTYGISTSVIRGTSHGGRLCKKDVDLARSANHIFILRPFGDVEGNAWQVQLIRHGVNPKSICRVGDLNAYYLAGPHIITQIFQSLHKVLVDSPRHLLLPLLKLPIERRVNKEAKINYLILPFAGSRNKWLPTKTLIGLAQKLYEQQMPEDVSAEAPTIHVAGTSFGDEPECLDQIETVLRRHSIPCNCVSGSMEEIALLAARCRQVYCVDGGICWSTIAGLNWLVYKGYLRKVEFPKITVIMGRDAGWNLAPTASVWSPLAANMNRVSQVNSDQEYRLLDLPVNEIVR